MKPRGKSESTIIQIKRFPKYFVFFQNSFLKDKNTKFFCMDFKIVTFV